MKIKESDGLELKAGASFDVGLSELTPLFQDKRNYL